MRKKETKGKADYLVAVFRLQNFAAVYQQFVCLTTVDYPSANRYAAAVQICTLDGDIAIKSGILKCCTVDFQVGTLENHRQLLGDVVGGHTGTRRLSASPSDMIIFNFSGLTSKKCIFTPYSCSRRSTF